MHRTRVGASDDRLRSARLQIALWVFDELVAFYENQPPVAFDDAYRFEEDSLLSRVLVDQGVLSNDIDADGNASAGRTV